MTLEVKTTDLQQGKQTKKIYQSPQLLIYGTIHEVTQAVGNKSQLDGPAGGSMDRTSV